MQVTYGAPTVIYVSCKNEDEEIIKGCNAGVVMENMLLEAADLGLGAVYLFGVSQVLFANEEITKLLQNSRRLQNSFCYCCWYIS